jgi:hypothetical protein
MSVVRLLDRDVATVDVVTKFFQPSRVLQNEIIDVVRFFQAAIGNVNRQLHTNQTVMSSLMLSEVKCACAAMLDT